MDIDSTTRAWIRNRSDELAAESGCRFDEERGRETCNWIEQFCYLYEGKVGPFILMPWQREMIMRLFGWIRWSDRLGRWIRRFTKASIWLPKKNGKTPSAAALALYLLAGDGEPGNHIFFAATDGTQARLAAKHAVEMVKASPALDAEQGGEIEINLSEMKLTHIPSRSDMKPISSGDNRAARAKQGLNGCIIVDETHVVSREFISESSINRAGISRDEPLHIEISTAGKNPDGYGKSQYDIGKQVERGEVVDQQLFFLCFEAPQDTTDEDIHADPVKYGKMANPSWGVTVNEGEFLADYNASKRSISDLADFKTFRLNIWQTTASPWLRMGDWSACLAPFTEDDLAGMTCVAGLDLGITRDMSALAYVFPMDDERFRILPFFFLPEKAAQTLAIKVPQVNEWIRDGFLITTPGDTTDYRYLKRLFAEKAAKFNVNLLVFDPRFAEQITQEMSEDTGVDREKFVQRTGLYNEATQNFERAVIDGKMEHNGNPLLTWQIGHTTVAADRWGQMMPVKPPYGDHKKIDGVAAAIMAFAGARVTPNNDNWFAQAGGLLGRGLDKPQAAGAT